MSNFLSFFFRLVNYISLEIQLFSQQLARDFTRDNSVSDWSSKCENQQKWINEFMIDQIDWNWLSSGDTTYVWKSITKTWIVINQN